LGGNEEYKVGATSIPGISASAARAKDGKVYVAIVNTNATAASDVAINVAGQKVSGVSGQVLTAAAMDAHNTFKQKDAVKPAPYAAKAVNGKLNLTIPAKAIVVVALEG
ncbi:MAG: alpha-L-arabinofuranosidase C-terminal domain-containing protein, partial [Massilia sp.]